MFPLIVRCVVCSVAPDTAGTVRLPSFTTRSRIEIGCGSLVGNGTCDNTSYTNRF